MSDAKAQAVFDELAEAMRAAMRAAAMSREQRQAFIDTLKARLMGMSLDLYADEDEGKAH